MSADTPRCPQCGTTLGEADPAGAGPPSCPRCAGRSVAPAPSPATRRRPAWLTLAVGVLCLGAVAWSALRVKAHREAEAERTGVGLAPTAIPGAAPTALSEGGPTMLPVQAMVGRFQVFRGTKAGDRPVMIALPAVWTDAPPGIILGPHFGTLARLVMEQAVLGTARDDLGMVTRVAGLGEAAPSGEPDLLVEVSTPYIPGDRVRFTVRRGGERGAVVSEALLPLTASDPWAYPKFVEMAESYARGPFAAALKKAGLGGRAPVVRAAGGVDPAVDLRLDAMSIPAQFAAVRALHAAIRADGESPERLGALVRGYANLGSLTEFQWTASSKLFKARALLYAQRMLARDPRSAVPLWHRAYALALSGLHRDALADLEAARKRAEAGAPPSDRPDWADLIDVYCHFDTAKLATLARGRRAGLAQLLRFYTAENYYDSPARTLVVAREALAANPECFRLIDALCQVGGVSNSHQATTIGPEVLAASLPERLRALPDLPERVAGPARKGGDVVALRHALEAAGAAPGDSGEPTWGALGRLVAETQFVQVWRRITFMHDRWHVPVVDELAQSRPALEGHPYRRFVESYGYGPHPPPEALFETLKGLNPADFELPAIPFFVAFAEIDPGVTSQTCIQAVRHADEEYREIQVAARTLQNDARLRVPMPRRLQTVSPHCPEAVALLIEQHWDEVKQDATTWEEKYGQHPAVLARLALRYQKLGRVDDERRCLEKYNAIAPSRWSYTRLAEIHQQAGRPDLWLATLEEFLKTPDDFGLEHASVQAQLARYFMGMGEFVPAVRYAEAAAQTGAGWAMECAGQANEGLGDFERAESWFRAEAERYPISFMQWFLFCKRTARGDAAGAARLADTVVKVAGARLTANEQSLAILLYDLADEPARGSEFVRALPPLDSSQGETGGRFAGWIEQMFLARFADAVDDPKVRDAAWAEAAKSEHPAAAKVAALFLKAGGGPLDLKAFDESIATADALASSYLCYFAGRYQGRHGPIESAARLWERCTTIVAGGAFVPMLGTNALRETLADRPLKDAHLLTLRARLHHMAGREEPAESDCDEALRLDPRSGEAYHLRGLARRVSGDLEGSLADFGKEIELAPESADGHVGRGITLILLARDDEARAAIDEAIDLAPRDGTGHLARGLLALAQGKDASARKSFARALQLNPNIAANMEKLKKAVMGRPRAKVTAREPLRPGLKPQPALSGPDRGVSVLFKMIVSGRSVLRAGSLDGRGQAQRAPERPASNPGHAALGPGRPVPRRS